jgi:hypothetical protein
MCTTFAKCKIVITTVFMVKSGMDPHMISSNLKSTQDSCHIVLNLCRV